MRSAPSRAPAPIAERNEHEPVRLVGHVACFEEVIRKTRASSAFVPRAASNVSAAFRNARRPALCASGENGPEERISS